MATSIYSWFYSYQYSNNTIFAKGIIDSTGYVQRPIFNQEGQESEQDSFDLQLKTKKAIIYGIKTKQDQLILLGEKSKRVNDSTIFIENARITTSDKKKPDYHIGVRKIKFVPNKKSSRRI